MNIIIKHLLFPQRNETFFKGEGERRGICCLKGRWILNWISKNHGSSENDCDNRMETIFEIMQSLVKVQCFLYGCSFSCFNSLLFQNKQVRNEEKWVIWPYCRLYEISLSWLLALSFFFLFFPKLIVMKWSYLKIQTFSGVKNTVTPDKL